MSMTTEGCRAASLRGCRKFWATRLLAIGTALLLAACGGGDGDDAAADAASASIGAAGGSVATPAGARVVIPAGALAAPTTIAIDRSSAGAPALPAGFAAAGSTFAFMPHGTAFSAAVTVSIPVDPAAVAAGRTPALYKTNAAGDWERVPGATLNGSVVTAQVTGFSWFSFGAAPPTISQQPQNATVNAGATATFSLTALGAPPFTYRWERSTDGGSSWTLIVGAADRTYTTPATAAVDNGTRFRAVVGNPDGETTSQAAILTVTTAVLAPAIATQPAGASIIVGASATFSVGVTGTAPLLQWQISRDGGTTFTDIAGATNASYVFATAALADNGALLRVVASNSAGSVTSMTAVLTVTTPGGGGGGASGAVIAVGSDFSVALLADGTVRSWGSDVSGTLGDGGADVDRSTPGAVVGLSDVVALDSSGSNTLALRRNGEVWGWGYNYFGALGNGGANPTVAPARYIGTAAFTGARAVSAGNSHSLVLRTDGRVEASGFNALGQLGNPAVLHDTATGVEVVVTAGMRPIIAISAGSGFSVALDEDGVVWTWGLNDVGQLGQGTTVDTNVPQRVVGIDPVRAISAGYNHVLAVARDGQLWSWGSNLNGKLGQGEIGNVRAQPGRVLLTGEIVGIAAGAEHSVSVHFDGTVFTWGINETGQLANGSGSPGYRSTPGFVSTLPSGIRAVAAGGGLGHSLALGPDGRVWTWGRNNHGQLGDGTTLDRLSPVVVPALNLN